jgi:hypothetical protein
MRGSKKKSKILKKKKFFQKMISLPGRFWKKPIAGVAADKTMGRYKTFCPHSFCVETNKFRSLVSGTNLVLIFFNF